MGGGKTSEDMRRERRRTEASLCKVRVVSRVNRQNSLS